MAPALPVGERRLRHVTVSWADLWQTITRQYLSTYRLRDQSAMARRVFIFHGLSSSIAIVSALPPKAAATLGGAVGQKQTSIISGGANII
jgi:hypothetical protein